MTETARHWKTSTVIRECVKEFGNDMAAWPEADCVLVNFTTKDMKHPEAKASFDNEGWEGVAIFNNNTITNPYLVHHFLIASSSAHIGITISKAMFNDSLMMLSISISIIHRLLKEACPIDDIKPTANAMQNCP